MLFSSPHFIFGFLPFVLAAYYALHALGLRDGAKNLFLIAASLVFYGWANPWAVPLLPAMSGITWLCGRAMGRAREEGRATRAPLTIVVLTGVASLIALKSAGVASAVWPDSFLTRVGLPVGFSFLVFQCIAYGFDVYRRRTQPAKSFCEFLTFTALFPRVMAGPVLRFDELAADLRERRHSIDQVALGLTRFSFGLAKKVLLADPLRVMADAAFAADAGSLGMFSSWMGIMAFAFAIAFDLSAYADMAAGIARALGFTFPENMESPYSATSIGGFWRRWHVTVTRFFRDCVFVPLGGDKGGTAMAMCAVMIAALLGALWHGATAGFLVWGAMHGVMLAAGRMKLGAGFYDGLPRLVKVAITFALLLITWVFFRAGTIGDAIGYLAIMFGRGPALMPAAAVLDADMLRNFNTLTLVAAMIGTWVVPDTQTILRRFAGWKALIGLVLFIVSAAMLSTRGSSPFIYFQF